MTEFRLPIFAVEIPENSDTGRLLNNHLKLTGLSPDVTRH